jgi:SAM-dependent methyltransferase
MYQPPPLQGHPLDPLLVLLHEPAGREDAVAALQGAGLLNAELAPLWLRAMDPPMHARDRGDFLVRAWLQAERAVRERSKLSAADPVGVLFNMQLLLPLAAARGFAGLQGARVLDLGAGLFYPLSTAALLHANGAAEAIAFEPFAVHAEICAAALQRLILAVMDDPRPFAFPGVDPGQLQHRLMQLDLRHLVPRLEQGAVDLGGVRLERTLDAVAPASLDLIFSNSVLEHIDALDGSLRQQHGLLKPGGFACHTVDFADHRHYEDRRIHPLQCLVDGSPVGTNGLRSVQVESLFRDSGFRFEKLARLAFPREVLQSAVPRHPRYDGVGEASLNEWVNGYLLWPDPAAHSAP